MLAMGDSSRAGAIARAQRYLDAGDFERDLTRRVAIRTESQELPRSLPELHRYVDAEMGPSFEAAGFKCRKFENPVKGQGPVLLATRIEDPKLPTVLGYGHGDVIRGQDAQWTKGKGPWVSRATGNGSMAAGPPTTSASTRSISPPWSPSWPSAADGSASMRST